MKFRTGFYILASTATLLAVLTGCASKPATTTSRPAKAKYIYLAPETGSHVGRRAKVNPDGSTEQLMPSATTTTSPDAIRRVQDKGAVNRGTGN